MYALYKIMQDYIQKGNVDLNTTIQTNDLDTTLFTQFSTPEDFKNVVNQLAIYFNNTFQAYFQQKFAGTNQSKRISLLVNKRSDSHYLIQLILYDYVPLLNSVQSVFMNTLRSAYYPRTDPKFLYRTFESHVFELEIINMPFPSSNYQPLSTLTQYAPWNDLLTTLNRELNTAMPSASGGIDIGHLYFQDLYTMTKEYQQILYEGKGPIHKQKYIHRLLGTEPHEPKVYNEIEPFDELILEMPSHEQNIEMGS